jgi:hypothetical protein
MVSIYMSRHKKLCLWCQFFKRTDTKDPFSKIKKVELGPSGLDTHARSTSAVIELSSPWLMMLRRSYHRGAARGSEQSHITDHHHALHVTTSLHAMPSATTSRAVGHHHV